MGTLDVVCVMLIVLYWFAENFSCQKYEVTELSPSMQDYRVSPTIEMKTTKFDTIYNVSDDNQAISEPSDGVSEVTKVNFVEPSFTIHVSYLTGNQLVTDIPLVFDILSYNNTCNEEIVDINKACIIRKYDTHALEVELCKDFLDIIRLAYDYSCFYNVPSNQITKASQGYVKKLSQLLETLRNPQENDTYTDYVQSVTIVQNIKEFAQQTDSHGALERKVYLEMQHYQLEDIPYIIVRLIPEASKVQEEYLQQEAIYWQMTVNLTNYLEENNLVGIFPYLYSILLERAEIVKDNFEKDAEVFANLKVRDILYAESNETFGRLDKILLTFSGVLFFIGIILNSLLLMVFICFIETRTHANALLIQLTIVDTVSLVFNILVYNIIDQFFTSCTVIWILVVCRSMSFIVSIFSIVALSIQRYLAIANSSLNSNPRVSMKTITIISITCIWVLGLIYSLSSFALVEYEDENCNYPAVSLSFVMLNIQFCIMCLVPLILFIIFSVMAFRKLRESVRSLPGERIGHNETLKSRTVSSNIILGLMILAVISYVPHNILLYCLYFNTSAEVIPVYRNPTVFEYTRPITYNLMFLNSCFNPLALYLMSKTFRKYFHAVLLCGRKSSNINEGQTTSTQLSNL